MRDPPSPTAERLAVPEQRDPEVSDEGLLAPPIAAERKAIPDLRPRTLGEFAGQRRVVEALGIAIRATQERDEALEHVLLSGPPGLGKTTLAQVIAREIGVELRWVTGSSVERVGNLISLLTSLEEGDVVCIEGIHRLPADAVPLLCQAMSEYTADIVFDKGAHARIYRSRLQAFTLVGTAPSISGVPRRLRDQFGICLAVEYYSAQDLAELLRRSAALLDVGTDDAAVRMIAERSRGTPRVANRLLRRARDYAQTRGNGRITREVAKDALAVEGVDDLGLTPWDRAVLQTLVKQYRGGPVAARTLFRSLRREGRELAETIEPYLLASGLVTFTRGGLVATEKTRSHLERGCRC